MTEDQFEIDCLTKRVETLETKMELQFMNKQYKVSIIQFNGEGETLKAQALYEQTVEQLNIHKVIEAVNAMPEHPPVKLVSVPRKRAPRSDKGKKRGPVPPVTMVPRE